jgi:hypothetical protein
MVRQYLNWIFHGLQFWAPFLKGTDDSHQLFVVNLIIALRGGLLLREKGHRKEHSLVVELREYPSGNMVGNVSLNDDVTVVVEAAKHGSGGEGDLQRGECGLLLGTPPERDTLTRQASE